MPHETPSQPRDRRAPRPPRRPEARRPASTSLAAFELLAHPDTIAGGVPVAEAPTGRGDPADVELARLRLDLDRQTRELDAIRARLQAPPTPLAAAPDEASPAPDEASPAPGRPRLDVASATRLAEEARRRERASRAALAVERAALTTPDTALEPLPFASPASPPIPKIEPDEPPAAPRGWTTLAIATADLPSPATQTEILRLRSRIASNERELEAREEERRILRQTLDEQERTLADRDSQLAGAETRIASLNERLERVQRELAGERSQRGAVERILGQLRHALTNLEQRPSAEARRELEPASDSFAIVDGSTARVGPRPARPARSAPASAGPIEAEAIRPAVFDVWQDAQIRRHFGPLGIDSFVDLARRPIARRARSAAIPIGILLLGRGAWSEAAKLAAGLVQREPSPFLIHVADPFDPKAEGLRTLGRENPLGELIRPIEAPATPEALTPLLASLGPDLLVSSHFLSGQADPAAWLDAFEGQPARGGALIFAERTGTTIPPLPSAIGEIGERIWARMPARYKRGPESDTPIQSWREAFERSTAVHANGCLDALRRHFELELFARFGHLAEPFIGAAIGVHFRVDRPRDLRFLTQVADVDDRQIEAGIAPALHFVALVDSNGRHEQEPTR